VRTEGVQSHRSTRGSHAPSWSVGKRRTGERVAGSTEAEGMLARDALRNSLQKLLETGEPVAVKAARRVREGAIGEGSRLAVPRWWPTS
jgi:hypothetical protein